MRTAILSLLCCLALLSACGAAPKEEDLAALIRAYVTDEDGTSLFPTVESGRCFFLDRQADARDHSPAAVQQRASMNFTAALYDADTLTLYYYELDT